MIIKTLISLIGISVITGGAISAAYQNKTFIDFMNSEWITRYTVQTQEIDQPLPDKLEDYQVIPVTIKNETDIDLCISRNNFNDSFPAPTENPKRAVTEDDYYLIGDLKFDGEYIFNTMRKEWRDTEIITLKSNDIFSFYHGIFAAHRPRMSGDYEYIMALYAADCSTEFNDFFHVSSSLLIADFYEDFLEGRVRVSPLPSKKVPYYDLHLQNQGILYWYYVKFHYDHETKQVTLMK